MAVLKNLWLRQAKQRLGGAVTYMLKGQQVVRELSASVSNPRTNSQMSQRVRFANLVAFYRANRAWMERYAFETRPQTWSVYNAFMSANLASNKIALTKAEADGGFCIVAPYQVTKGSLPSIDHDLDTTTGNWQTNLQVGEFDLAGATIASLTEALFANNNGLQAGDQLSLIVNYQSESNNVATVIARYYEVILSTSNSTPLSERLSDEHVAIVNGTLGFTAGASDPVMGFTYVLSRDNGSSVRVSSQNLTLTDTGLYSTYIEDAQWAKATSSYGSGSGTAFLAAGYQSGSNADVVLQPSIIAAALDAGSVRSVGQVLGYVRPASSFTLNIILNREPDNAPSAVSVTTTGGVTQAADIINAEGRSITANFGSYQGTNADYITLVKCTIDGVELTGAFAEQSEITE